MEIRYFKHWSFSLNRDMEFKVYGSGQGKAVIFIPCQGGRFFDFEGFHMIDHWAPFIESGRCTVYAVDSIDNEAWAAQGCDNRWRIENHEKWFHCGSHAGDADKARTPLPHTGTTSRDFRCASGCHSPGLPMLHYRYCPQRRQCICRTQ